MELLGYGGSNRRDLDGGSRSSWQVLQAILPFWTHCSLLPSHQDANWSPACNHHHHCLTSLKPWAMIHNSCLKAVPEHLGNAKAEIKWRQISLCCEFTCYTTEQVQPGEAVVFPRKMKANNGNIYGDWVKTGSCQVLWLHIEQSDTGPHDKSKTNW